MRHCDSSGPHSYTANNPPSLQDSDRDVLKSAAKSLSTHVTVGSLAGLGLGIFLAYRIRSNRTAMFTAFKTAEKPTHVQFAGGRSGAFRVLDSPPPFFVVPSLLMHAHLYMHLCSNGR